MHRRAPRATGATRWRRSPLPPTCSAYAATSPITALSPKPNCWPRICAHARSPWWPCSAITTTIAAPRTRSRRCSRHAGVIFLEGDVHAIDGVGFAGVKGFCGGFDGRMLDAFGEAPIKAFVQEVLDQALRLEHALKELETERIVVVLHYAPIAATVAGEAEAIFPFLGCSRLAETIDRFELGSGGVPRPCSPRHLRRGNTAWHPGIQRLGAGREAERQGLCADRDLRPRGGDPTDTAIIAPLARQRPRDDSVAAITGPVTKTTIATGHACVDCFAQVASPATDVDRHSAAPLLVGVESAPLHTPIRVPLSSGSAHCQSPVGADRVRLGLPGWRIGPAVSLMCSPVGASQRFDQAVAHPAQTVRIASSALVKFEVASVAVPNQLAFGNLSGDKLSRYAAISMTLPIRCPCLARSDWGSTFVIQTCIIANLGSETSRGAVQRATGAHAG